MFKMLLFLLLSVSVSRYLRCSLGAGRTLESKVGCSKSHSQRVVGFKEQLRMRLVCILSVSC